LRGGGAKSEFDSGAGCGRSAALNGPAARERGQHVATRATRVISVTHVRKECGQRELGALKAVKELSVFGADAVVKFALAAKAINLNDIARSRRTKYVAPVAGDRVIRECAANNF